MTHKYISNITKFGLLDKNLYTIFYYFSKKEEKMGENRTRCPLKKIQSTWSNRR